MHLNDPESKYMLTEYSSQPLCAVLLDLGENFTDFHDREVDLSHGANQTCVLKWLVRETTRSNEFDTCNHEMIRVVSIVQIDL